MSVKSRFLATAALCALSVVMVAWPGRAQAADLTYYFNSAFSGDTPDGTPPYLLAAFTNDGLGGVDLTITALFTGDNFVGGYTGAEGGVYFNYVGSTPLSSLVLTNTGGSQAFAGYATGSNAFKADGDGSYDLTVQYAGSGAGRLTSGETTTIHIAGATAADFYALSEPPTGGHGPYYAAAHVQGTSGPEGSGWIYADEFPPGPEPAFFQMAGFLGMGGLGLLKLRRRQK